MVMSIHSVQETCRNIAVIVYVKLYKRFARNVALCMFDTASYEPPNRCS